MCTLLRKQSYVRGNNFHTSLPKSFLPGSIIFIINKIFFMFMMVFSYNSNIIINSFLKLVHIIIIIYTFIWLIYGKMYQMVKLACMKPIGKTHILLKHLTFHNKGNYVDKNVLLL